MTLDNDTERRETAHRWLKVAVVAWLAVMLVAAPAAAQTETATPTDDGPAPCAVGPPIYGEEAQADDGNDTATGDLEVALVNDRSGSMSGDRIAALKDAATGFIERLATPDEVATVSFRTGAALDQPLTTDYAAAIDSIETLEAPSGGDSDIDAGIETATAELTTGENASAAASKAMVVLTDAEFDSYPNDAVAAADAAKAEGITIYAVGLGGAVNETVLQDISTGGNYYVSPDPEDLDSIYQEIGGEIDTGPVASDLIIETRSLYQPGETHSYTVKQEILLSNNRTIRENVTGQASVTTTNSSILSVDQTAHTLSATGEPNTSTWVRVDATANGSTGCTNVIVAQPSVENLELIPGLWRVSTVISDSTIFAILIAGLVAVVGTRMTTSWGGLAMGQMALVIGWLGGYVTFGIAAVGLFTALFIGLNLAANIDYQMVQGR